MIQNIIDFCNYWWFRYLMVTELYMVEKWERITIHVIFAVLFILFWYFNYSVLISFTGSLFGITPISTIMEQQNTILIIYGKFNLFHYHMSPPLLVAFNNETICY